MASRLPLVQVGDAGAEAFGRSFVATPCAPEQLDGALGRLPKGVLVWLDAPAGEALAAAAKAAATRGARVVLPDWRRLEGGRAPELLEALAAEASVAGGAVAVGGSGVGSLAVASLIRLVRTGETGAVRKVAVRAPGGRRTSPASSRRTPFGADNGVSFALDAEGTARALALGGEAWRLAELFAPGAGAALEVCELLLADKAMLSARARVGGTSVEVDVDEEMSGECPLEVEVVGEAGTWVARLGGRGGDAVLRDGKPLPLEARRTEELLALHAASPALEQAGLADARTVARVLGACRAALARAEQRRARRPLELVLVHVPRFRNLLDELSLPSLALARLTAFMRGYGFPVRVVDLAETFADAPLDAFADDQAVDAWLATNAPGPVADAVDRLWPALVASLPGERALVGFSIVDYFGHFQMNLASCLARRVKDETPHATVLGGERDQVDGERGLSPGMPFDWVVEGDGERALLELAHLVAYGDRAARDLAAVWSRDGEQLVRNKMSRSHLNAMPRPDFDGVPLERYRQGPSPQLRAALERDGLFTPGTPIEPFAYLPYGFVKGCPAKCTFCSAKEWLNVQAPEKSVDELLALRDRYGVRDFVFLNNLVNVGPKYVERFCRLLVDARAGIQWTDSCRPTGLSAELTALMREAGCLLLNYGAESGSDDILLRMKKGLTSRDILESLANAHRAGIFNRVNLIAGYFHEKPEDVDKTIALVETLNEAIDVVGCFQGFYLFPGMGVDPEKEGIRLRGGLDRLKTGQMTVAYDEVGGLAWEDKREAIDGARNRILERIESLGIRTVDKINEYDLFWLSRRFPKDVVKRYLLAPPEPRQRANSAPLPPGGQRGRVDVAR